jgi:hypothetical protein
MSKYIYILIIVLILGVFFFFNNKESQAFSSGSGTIYSFGEPALTDICINQEGDILYAPYAGSNAVIEIDANNMVEIRSFTVLRPYLIGLSSDEDYVYTLSIGMPGYLVRIRLSDGFTDSIEVEGEPRGFELDYPNHRMWVIHRLWPPNNTPVGDPNSDAPPGTGRLSEIDLLTFTVTQTQTIESVPESVWYSPVAERLFVYHGLTHHENDEIPIEPGSDRVVQVMGESHERITIYDVSTLGLIRVEPEELNGGGHFIDWSIGAMVSWDDSGAYVAIPSIVSPMPPFSMRVANASDLSFFDLTFDDANETPIGALNFNKVPGQNVVWVVNGQGSDIQGGYGAHKFAVRVETTPPYNFETYIVNEATGQYGDFAVSPDGNTLYLTQWTTGEIIVWSPD